MKILVLGGTRFLGRFLVEAAREAGHQVTLFHRGRTGTELFPGVPRLLGDRSRGDYASLAGESWDAVVDVPTDQPRWVAEATRALAGSVGHYTFVSSVSVYADLSSSGLDEEAPVATCPDGELARPEFYGARKARCEEIVRSAFPDGSLVVRPGLVVGPHDPSDRFTYWPRRLARGGSFLAPGDGTSRTQFVDVRDLARWILELVEARVLGTFHATGPEAPLTLGEFFSRALVALGARAEPTWIPEESMERLGVAPWTDLPAFVPRAMQGMLSLDPSRALAAGLRLRPLEETVRDTLAWDLSRPPPPSYQAGLTPSREASLLERLREE